MHVSVINTAHFHVCIHSFIHYNAEDAVTHRARGEFPHDRVRRPQHDKNAINTKRKVTFKIRGGGLGTCDTVNSHLRFAD